MTLNNIPINFIISRLIADGKTYEPVYNQVHYIQYNIDKETSFIKELIILKKLSRNYKTYFYILPKELIDIIKYYCIVKNY